MTNGFRDWIIGMTFFLILAWLLQFIGNIIIPYNHYSFLECWGIVMLFVTIKTGIDSWNSEEE
jgi:hypothetical protein